MSAHELIKELFHIFVYEQMSLFRSLFASDELAWELEESELCIAQAQLD